MTHDIRVKKLEKVIAKKDYEQAEKLTEELYQEMPPIDTSLPADFAETIKIMDRKGTRTMKKNKLKIGIIAAAALVAVSGTTVFAVSTLTKYYKIEDGKLVQTTEDDKDMVMELYEEPVEELDDNTVLPGKTFDTLKTAEKETGIANLLPDGVKGYKKDRVSGLYAVKDEKQEDCKGISANFVNGDKTVLYDYFLDGAANGDYYPNGTGETEDDSVTTKSIEGTVDAEAMDSEPTSYTNQHGVTFTVTSMSGLSMTEDGSSTETSMEIMKSATVNVGTGLLSISFVGLSDEEMQEVLEQVVLP